jgi:hypothetical protein
MEPLNAKERNRSIIRFTLIQGAIAVLLFLLFFIGFTYPKKVKQQQIAKMNELNNFKQQLFVLTDLVKSLTPKIDSIATSKDDLSRTKLENAIDAQFQTEMARIPELEKQVIITDFLDAVKALILQTKGISSNLAKLNAGASGNVSKAFHENTVLDLKKQINELEGEYNDLKKLHSQCD